MFFYFLGILSVAASAKVHRMNNRLPGDVEEWVNQMNEVEETKDEMFHSKVETRSDCSIVVTLWKKMGKETILDPQNVAPMGCCSTKK